LVAGPFPRDRCGEGGGFKPSGEGRHTLVRVDDCQGEVAGCDAFLKISVCVIVSLGHDLDRAVIAFQADKVDADAGLDVKVALLVDPVDLRELLNRCAIDEDTILFRIADANFDLFVRGV